MRPRPPGFLRRMTSVHAAVLLLALIPLQAATAQADAPAARVAVLARGINITHWFRFVPNRNAHAMAADLDGSALVALKRVGFTYVRLPVGPEEVMDGQHIASDKLSALITAIGRIEQAGLGVMIEAHPELMQHWNLQNNINAQRLLVGFWQDLAPALRRFPAATTFPELVNEPMSDPSKWDALQSRLLAKVRAFLPNDTIILTGTDWSSIDGLLKTKPVADPDVIYSFHTYEPQLLTLLGSWDPAINKKQLAEYLPFPAADSVRCKGSISKITDPHTHAVAEYWCSLHPDAASIKKNLARAVQWGRMHNASVAMTEFGASSELNTTARLAYIAAVRRSAEQLGLPWALWGLDDQMGLDQKPGGFSSSEQLPAKTLHALGLEHPA